MKNFYCFVLFFKSGPNTIDLNVSEEVFSFSELFIFCSVISGEVQQYLPDSCFSFVLIFQALRGTQFLVFTVTVPVRVNPNSAS